MKRVKKAIVACTIALGTFVFSGAVSAAPYYVIPYYVKSNDTMYLISKKYGVSLTSLIRANPHVANPNYIWPGLRLNIPIHQYYYAIPDYGYKAPQYNNGGNTQNNGSKNVSVSQYAAKVAELVNQERAKAGLQPLTLDPALSAMALDKAKDMSANRYFDHYSPTYGSPFDMMNRYGIRYSYAGENIAMGQRSPEEVMKDWMNSPGHRKNILNPNFKKIGVAYYNGYWVQEFTG